MGRPRKQPSRYRDEKIQGKDACDGSTKNENLKEKKSIGKTKGVRNESKVFKKESSIEKTRKRRGMKRNNSSLNETDQYIDSVLKRYTPMPSRTPGRGQQMPDPFEYRPVTTEELPGMLDGVVKSIKAYQRAAMMDSASKHERARIEKVSLTQAHLLKEILIRECRLAAIREEDDQRRAETIDHKEDGQETEWDRAEAEVEKWRESDEDGRWTNEIDDVEANEQIDAQTEEEPKIDQFGAMIEVSSTVACPINTDTHSRRSSASVDGDQPMINLSIEEDDGEDRCDLFLSSTGGLGDEIPDYWANRPITPFDQPELPALVMDHGPFLSLANGDLFRDGDANFTSGIELLNPTEPLDNFRPYPYLFSMRMNVDDEPDRAPDDHTMSMTRRGTEDAARN